MFLFSWALKCLQNDLHIYKRDNFALKTIEYSHHKESVVNFHKNKSGLFHW